ncbi:FmdB family zinc ribbon protein [Marinospirillum sp.]|uniref:FmdB family zinc ribbon protein n=1 Tax=Marinospirillum sp. TaxID=2183934 RepID=UPI003A8805B9
MPIYEYQCQACDHQLEVMHKMSEAGPTRCPECGKDSLARQVSAAGFRLAGGGWYETDFKSGNKKNVAESSSSGASNAACASCPAAS